MKKPPDIMVSAVGIGRKKVYCAHERGNGGPEHPDSDYLKHPLKRKRVGGKLQSYLTCSAGFLEYAEEFKIFVFVRDKTEAEKISKIRQKKVKGNARCDFDENTSTLWIFAENYSVAWNRSNVFFPPSS